MQLCVTFTTGQASYANFQKSNNLNKVKQTRQRVGVNSLDSDFVLLAKYLSDKQFSDKQFIVIFNIKSIFVCDSTVPRHARHPGSPNFRNKCSSTFD